MKNIKNRMIGILIGSMFALNSLTPMASATALGDRVLKTGAAGEDVKVVQSTLHKMGYAVDLIDGVFGSKTHQAVANFQVAAGIKSDGVVGNQTAQALQQKSSVEAVVPVSKESTGAASQQSDKVLNIVATAYAPGHADNGVWGNLTHLGTQVRPGVIAVDPRIIPLGSKVYIEFPDGHGVHAVAEDTGGAIKGNRIDIAFATRAEAEQFGIQNVKVHVLK